MNPDSISVVIPAFNPGPYLTRALCSLIEQTYSEWNAVVVDDESTQDLSFVAALDERITLVRSRNGGRSAARNLGIESTSSRLVAFLDSDDVWLPEKLAKQVAAFGDASDAVLCSTDFEIIDGAGTRIGGNFAGGHASYLDLLDTCAICASTVIVRRDALEEVGLFDLRYRRAQDWDLWLRLARIGTLARCDDVLVQYRVHGSNASKDYERLLRDGTAILRANEALGDREVSRAARRGIRRLRRLVGAQAFDAFRESRRPADLKRALRLSPRITLSNLGRHILERAPTNGTG